LFIVLNYDDLLESALTRLYPSSIFNGIGDYIEPDLWFKVIRLHGSINWFIRMALKRPNTWDDNVENLDIPENAQESKIQVNSDIPRPIK
jgi:hypothetical protein